MHFGAMKKSQKRTGSREVAFDLSRRDELILEYSPQIKYIAHKLALRLPPYVELDDLINAGAIGLIDAISKFDPSRNIQFKTYAEFRIRGAMLDELRSQDWASRSVRQKASLLEKTYAEIEQREGRPASEEEVAGALGMTLEAFYELLFRARGISLVNIESFEEEDCIGRKIQKSLTSDIEESPLNILKKKELKHIIARIIDQLPENEKRVVSLYYFEELTMKEIGAVLDVTESRVSQIHTQSMLRMRGKLRKYYP